MLEIFQNSRAIFPGCRNQQLKVRFKVTRRHLMEENGSIYWIRICLDLSAVGRTPTFEVAKRKVSMRAMSWPSSEIWQQACGFDGSCLMWWRREDRLLFSAARIKQNIWSFFFGELDCVYPLATLCLQLADWKLQILMNMEDWGHADLISAVEDEFGWSFISIAKVRSLMFATWTLCGSMCER